MALPHVRRNCPKKKRVPTGLQPGTELRQLLKEIGVKVSCQGCRNWEARMNKWGPDGCREYRTEIIQRLKEAVSGTSWATVLTTGAGLLGKSYFSILDPFGSLVDEAIRRAETQ
jgi:hypothetical protein